LERENVVCSMCSSIRVPILWNSILSNSKPSATFYQQVIKNQTNFVLVTIINPQLTGYYLRNNPRTSEMKFGEHK